MDKVLVGQRQFTWMLTTIITAGGLMILPRELIRISDRDAWLSNLVPAMVMLLTCYLFYRLAAAYPGKHLFEISVIALGRWGGRLFNLILLLHIWLVIQRDLTVMSKFINITLLTETPVSSILLAMVGVLVYFGRLGIEDKARVNEIIYPIFLVFIIALPFMLSNEIRLQRLEPFMVEGMGRLFASGLINYGWFGDLIVMGAFLHTLSHAPQIHAALRNGLLTSVFLLTVVQLCIILVMGANLGEILVFPVYVLTQQIHLTDFLDRVELIVYAVWLPITILKVIIIYHAFQIGIGHLLQTKNVKLYNVPFGLLMIIASTVMLSTMVEVFNYSLYVSIVHTVFTQGMLWGMFALAWLREGKHWDKPRRPDEQRKWGWRTNGFIVAAFVPLIVGFLFARELAFVGIICSALHFLFKLLFVMASRKEAHAARSAVQKPLDE